MKNIVAKKLEKYESSSYKEIAFPIFKNTSLNYYCFAYECELEKDEGQYPLEDLLNMFSVSCGEYFGEPYIENGIKKSIVEIITISDKIEELIKILNFSTIIGKQINNFVCGKNIMLGVNYGNANLIVNSKKIVVPIYAVRKNRNTENFCVYYPEIQLSNLFINDLDLSNYINDNNEVEYVLIKENYAYVIYKKDNEEEQLVYNLKGFVRAEKVL